MIACGKTKWHILASDSLWPSGILWLLMACGKQPSNRLWFVIDKVLSIRTVTSLGGHISASRRCSLNLKCSAELALKNDFLTVFSLTLV